jgi:hypothetical protein
MGPSLEEPGVFCPKQIYYRLVRPQLENVSAQALLCDRPFVLRTLYSYV